MLIKWPVRVFLVGINLNFAFTCFILVLFETVNVWRCGTLCSVCVFNNIYNRLQLVIPGSSGRHWHNFEFEFSVWLSPQLDLHLPYPCWFSSKAVFSWWYNANARCLSGISSVRSRDVKSVLFVWLRRNRIKSCCQILRWWTMAVWCCWSNEFHFHGLVAEFLLWV